MTRARIIAGAIALVVAVAIVAAIYHRGRSAGAAAVTTKVQRQHNANVAEARTDERAAAATTQAIAVRVVRADAATDTLLRSTIEDLRNALAAVPPAAAPGAALPPAPVERMRDVLNASIARANRAADDPGAVP